MKGKRVRITSDGNHNKEPDWVPIPVQSPEKQTDTKITAPLRKKGVESSPSVDKDTV